ncbi:MAG: dihydrolipoyl dehydrogenase [Rickettsiales bacterium]|jgi:dihydrolipoamide dehydrogenase|nr:dihydrolipoyl dehydrogenase [Rickettsiales bacterium]
MENFDVVVIGGGPGGYVAAIKAAQLGLKTACIEKRSTLGGTCLNVGCIPSKSLLEFSHHFHDAEHNFAEYGIDISKPKSNIAKMMAKKDEIIKGLTGGIEGLFKKNKVTYYKGFGTIINKNEVTINLDGKDQNIKAKNIIIATGSEVTPLPGVEIDEKVIVSSTGALALKKVPKKMILIGAGVIGLELGSVWSRLGSEVEVIEYSDKICPFMDKDVSRGFKKILESQDFKFHLKRKVTSAKKTKSGVEIIVEDQAGGNAEAMKADVVLVAIGRRPYTEGLGLVEVGVELDERGFVKVNDKFQTAIPNIYAIGDVVPGPMLAHKAEDEGVIAAEIIAGQSGHIDYNLVPSVVYTYPEIASVGQTEDQLKEAGISYNVGKFSMMANSRARATLSDEGFVKILADKKTDKLLGCHIISREAGNLIHEAVIVMEYGGSSEDLARICHAHPTLNESLKEAAMATYGKPIHS